MSINSFIPELWSARLNTTLRDSLVFGSCCNTDYEGEIRQAGDTVRINQVGEVTINDAYTKNSTSITPETLTDYQTTLLIDETPYFSFQVDDIDRAQINVNAMDEAMQSAAWGLRNHADEHVAALYGDAGYTTSSTAIDSTNVLAAFLTMGQKLSEKNVPTEGRWAVVSPWICTKLALAKVLVHDAGVAAGAWSNGFQGRVAGFDVYESNNVYTSSSTYYPLFGHRKAISFAGQINAVEAFRPEAKFADAVKGLYVYGTKVVYPNALGCLVCTVNAEP